MPENPTEERTMNRETETTRHGTERGFCQETTEIGPRHDYAAANVGVISLPVGYVSTPVGERYCEDCGWQKQRGILAALLGCPNCERSW